MSALRARALVLAGLFAVGACGANTATGGSSASTTRSSARSGVSAEAISKVSRQAATADVGPAVTSANRFGLSLLATDLGLDNGNVAMSPWSIATALTMARVGAKGQTATEMDKVLHIDDPAGIHASANALDRALAERNGTFDLNGGTQVVELSAANRAFAQRDYAFEQPFLDTLAADYGVGVGLVDYQSATEAARRSINEWVSTKTKDRIPTLIDKGVLDDRTRLVLVNALYLKADWQIPFEEASTAPGAFHAPSGDVNVPMMHGSEHRNFATAGGWKAVELPYADGKLAMLVVLPDAGRFDAASAALGTVLDTMTAASGGEVNLTLPKFDIASSVSLKEQLVALGMPTAFSDAADFSAMTTTAPLQLADVVHQANLTVNEHGTVASAATGVIARPASLPLHVEQIVVDRPFLYTIVDKATGAILFAGQVTNPALKT